MKCKKCNKEKTYGLYYKDDSFKCFECNDKDDTTSKLWASTKKTGKRIQNNIIKGLAPVKNNVVFKDVSNFSKDFQRGLNKSGFTRKPKKDVDFNLF